MQSNINKSKKGPHFLRHTFASLLYMKSKDLVLVQEALGHADINTSRIYTHFDKDKLKVAMDIYKIIQLQMQFLIELYTLHIELK